MHDRSATGAANHSRSDPGVERLRTVLTNWRSSLLDMGGRNRLLNFKHTKSATLEITAPDFATILSGLARSWDVAPAAETVQTVVIADSEVRAQGAAPGKQIPRTGTRKLVTQKATEAALKASVNQLRRKSGQMYNDFGLWVLWLGVGMLDWRENEADEISCAPLVLVPVELRRNRQGNTRLHVAENQERIHNPALAVKLAALGIDWSPVAETDTADVSAVLAAARDVAAEQKDFSVEERVVLGLFSSHKEAMYQDLLNNEDQILRHPLVRAVALGPDSGLPDHVIGFEPPELDRIDEIQLPERTPLVLDADASQRQCIAVALDNRSFVMSGPPGTGKSQTITNMIAALMHAGRSVLFVSEKAAALDVVRNRLRGVGLGDFVMALHSGDTTKKAVARELARVLTTEARVTGAPEHELDRARRLREELSAYAAAMNIQREPLLRTLHDVLGRLVALEQAVTPQLPLRAGSSKDIRTLSAGALQELTAAAGAISRAWRPAAEGEAFAWRGLVGNSALSVLAEAEDALAALRVAAGRRPFADTIAEPSTARDLNREVRTLRVRLPGRTSTPGAAIPEDLSSGLAELAGIFGFPEPATPEAAFGILELADLTSADVRPPSRWFDPEALSRAHAAEQELREALAVRARARAAAEDVFGEQVLTAAELPALVQRFEEQHRSVWSRFSSSYKADRKALAELTRVGTWDKALVGRLGQALTWQKAATDVASLVERHATLLGDRTPRDEDDLPDLGSALGTADRIAELALAHGADDWDLLASRLAADADPDPLPGLLTKGAREALGDWCDAAAQRSDRWSAAAAELLEQFDGGRRAQLSPALLGTFSQAQQVVDDLGADRHGPEEWHAHRSGLDVLARHGTEDLVSRAAERGVLAEQLPAVVEQAVLKAWADDILATDTRLSMTRSADLDARVIDFQEADRLLIDAASGAVIEECNKRRPRRFSGGAAGVITREAEKKARHMPVRELLARTQEVVHAVKPCFMMSPLTVSQFLPADYRFDVVIFDEASQVRPNDAVNCIYRGQSLIVAGDEKQLPPTSFFDSAVDDDSDEYEEDVPDSFESLLDACKAGAVRVLPLQWHYRSRHEDLITFSNKEFYENSMVTFPGALDQGNDVGVEFFAAEGVYDRGGRRDNRIEAEVVAERVIHHFDTRPGRTLGVVALSQPQASAIDQAVQHARLLRPDLDHCFTEDRLDGFFVKNLESVQGDERDVMIMSIGYGPDEHNKLTSAFGPINRGGGWRRLNVAVTRARYRMEVVASFHGNRLPDSQNESVQFLKRYLQYAQDGPAILAQDVVQDADAGTESPFEESVLQVLREWGYEVQPQVGVAGFRIDLGLRHPEAPGAYALGIECDGAMYHSSKAARDRDRLREQVLRGLGWKLHRIWGTDWYRGRTAAKERLREAVEQAVADGPLDSSVPAATGSAAAPDGPAQRAESATSVVEHDRVPVVAEPDRPWSAPYMTCEAYRATSGAELHTPEALPELRLLLSRIIQAEGPVHEDLLVQRAREAWGMTKAGSRIRQSVRSVVQSFVHAGWGTADGEFIDSADRLELKARFPSGDVVRKAGQIAPAERQLAMCELAAECPGMTSEELIRHVCEFFGWKRRGSDIRAALEADIAELYERGTFVGSTDRITVVR